ncbi:MAG: hypothetical protein AAFP13_07530 [Pseudomonadota bacterium]
MLRTLPLVLPTLFLVAPLPAAAQSAYVEACSAMVIYERGPAPANIPPAQAEQMLAGLCGCFGEVLAQVGISEAEATETMTRIVAEDAMQIDVDIDDMVFPQFYRDFDLKTRTGFEFCELTGRPG